MLARETHAHPARFSRVLALELRRAPLLFAACALALGVAYSQFWRPAALMVVCTASLLVLTAAALRFAPRVAPMAVLTVWFGLGWTLGILHPPAVPTTAAQPYADGLRRDVVAAVTALHPLPTYDHHDNDPQHPWEQAPDQEAAASKPAWSADLQILQIEQPGPDISIMVPLRATVRVMLPPQDASGLHCGSVVRATVRLYRPREYRVPGVWSYRNWLAEQDVAATGTLIPGHLQPSGRGSTPLSCRLQQTRTWASSRLRSFAAWQSTTRLPAVSHWTQADTAAWSAMLFGDRTALAQNLRLDFERTGTFHLFVVSGMHNGLVAAVILWCAERLRLNRFAAALFTALTTTGYALLTGFGEPVQRALLMTLIYLLARVLGRERNALNAVGAAVLAVLAARPQSLRDSSFQMTVLIAVTIAGLAVPVLERTLAPYSRACRHLSLVRLDRSLPPHVAQFRVLLRWCVQDIESAIARWAGQVLLLSVRAFFALLAAAVLALLTELIMALPMAVYFHRVTYLALPANLLVVPLLVPLMLCGIITFLFSLISYPCALVASVPAALLLHATQATVHTLTHLATTDLRTPGPSGLVSVALACCIALSVSLLRVSRRWMAWTGVSLAGAVAIGAVLLARRPVQPHALQVTAIDVGQGDSILLTAPDGRTMLIDAGGTIGSETRADSAFDVGEQVVSPFLWHRGVHHLDILALTHAHMDHLGGMAAVLRNFRPRELWLSVDVPSEHLRALLLQARKQGTTVRFLRYGAGSTWGPVHFDVLAPSLDYKPGDSPANDDSLVLLARYGQASALLAGDAEDPEEKAILERHILGSITLLKVGHHGSMTSTSELFLRTLRPQCAVISCGRNNHFGHPRMPVLQRLQQAGSATDRTDTMGTVEFTLEANGAIQTHALPGE